MTRLLHFTLGPVQGFVAQARRTQDLWAGSFLLSLLSGQAMRAVVEADGEIVLPTVSGDPLFQAIRSGDGGAGPAVGSLPNRFKARVADDFDPAACRTAVRDAWCRLAETVWERFVAPVKDAGADTKTIWDRQIERFWETAWVVGPDPGDRSDLAWLDRRKNWRSHRPPVEPGDHCMLMREWQELSGFVRSRERRRQNEFWQALKTVADESNPLDLDHNERLCAVALVKRLFPRVADEVLGWRPSWDAMPVHWPSTPRLAAAGWLRHAWTSANDEAEAYVDAARGAGLNEPELEPGNHLSRVAGHLLHASGVEFAQDDELGDASRDDLRKAHARLVARAGEPSAFYALLLMDGDRVGALLHDQGEDHVSDGLSTFGGQVDAAVRRHGGNTVYAGGDDVLALMPLEAALPVSLELRRAYGEAFDDRPSTISAALVFAHFHVPLRHVLREARHRLDDVAKDGNGRDSLAVCVLAQGGVTRGWVSSWDEGAVSPPEELMRCANDLDERTSGRFFHTVGERYREVLSSGAFGLDDVRTALLAEYRRSGAAQTVPLEEAGRHIDRLVVLAASHAGAESRNSNTAPAFSFDGPLIARFLAGHRPTEVV